MNIELAEIMQLNKKIFHYNSLKINLHYEVYEPSEDTFLLLDSIIVEKDQNVLEIGAGTGIISLVCAQKGAQVLCSDVNPYAIETINKNIKENQKQLKGSIEVRTGDLFEIVIEKETFDIIIFNPPYLPTTKDEKKGISEWYAKSFDGGVTGLTVTIKFLKELKPYLKKDGKAYFIYSSLSKKQKLEQTLKSLSFKYTIIKQLRCDDEILSIYQISL